MKQTQQEANQGHYQSELPVYPEDEANRIEFDFRNEITDVLSTTAITYAVRSRDNLGDNKPLSLLLTIAIRRNDKLKVSFLIMQKAQFDCVIDDETNATPLDYLALCEYAYIVELALLSCNESQRATYDKKKPKYPSTYFPSIRSKTAATQPAAARVSQNNFHNSNGHSGKRGAREDVQEKQKGCILC